MAKSDASQVFRIPYHMLKLTGTWPKDNSPLWYRLWDVTTYVIGIVLGMTMLLEAYYDLSNLAKLSEILYILITIITYLFKHGSFFVHRKTFILMIKLLNDPIFLSYSDDLDYLMQRRIKYSKLLANCYRILLLSCIILMGTFPLFENKPLPFPFPYSLGKYRLSMYLFQITALSISAWINSCLDSLTACLMGLAATHLEILSRKIIEIKVSLPTKEDDCRQSEEVLTTLKQCVENHEAIIRYIQYIDEVFSFGVLSQFLGSAIIICNTLFNFVQVSSGSLQSLMLFNYMGVILSQLFMYCWFGNNIIWKSINIGEACYAFNWYNCGTEAGQYLFIIMERSVRPLRVTAFKFSTLSLTAFASIIRWSYSYFTLMMNLYKKES